MINADLALWLPTERFSQQIRRNIPILAARADINKILIRSTLLLWFKEMANQLTRSDYAVYKGVGNSMVSNWIKDDRIVLSPDGKFVMVEESDARIKETASLNGSFYERVAGKERAEINAATEEQLILKANNKDNVDTLYKKSRALKEKATAEQKALEHEKYKNNLVSREYVEKILFERARHFRDQLTISARRMAPLVAGNVDITEVERLLNEEHRVLLDAFAKLPIIEH